MSRKREPVGSAFEPATLLLPIDSIAPLRKVAAEVRKSSKYAQIAASIAEIGLVEPPVVARERMRAGGFILLDGHLRLDVLRGRGVPEVDCLVATDDEAFTYNKRINRLAMIQENRMINAALARGVPDEKLARALNISLSSLRAKRDLLSGICPEAAEILKDRHVAQNAFFELKRMKPLRQVEAAELMVAMNRFTVHYVRSLVAATPAKQLIEKRLRKPRKLGPDSVRLMEREAAALDREFRRIEQDFGVLHLDLVLARAYVTSLLSHVRIVRWLAEHQPDILSQFQKLDPAQPRSSLTPAGPRDADPHARSSTGAAHLPWTHVGRD